jgi:geranylgeranyl pyrophosphate synthase
MNLCPPKEVKDKIETLVRYKLHNEIKPSNLRDAMEYAVLVGGKRIRPELLVQTGRMLGADDNTLFEVATGFEMIYSATLLFDDLPCMDDDDIRRGKPTTHKVFDEAIAVLAGISLILKGIEVIAEENASLGVVVTNTFGANRCVYGQMMDINATGTQKDKAYIDEMHIEKTGSLIEGSFELGYLCSNASSEVRGILDSVSHKVGLLYQIHNDILDVVGYDGRKGRDVAIHKKSTYPALFGLEGANQKRDAAYKDAIEELNLLPPNYDTKGVENAIKFLAYRDY